MKKNKNILLSRAIDAKLHHHHHHCRFLWLKNLCCKLENIHISLAKIIFAFFTCSSSPFPNTQVQIGSNSLFCENLRKIAKKLLLCVIISLEHSQIAFSEHSSHGECPHRSVPRSHSEFAWLCSSLKGRPLKAFGNLKMNVMEHTSETVASRLYQADWSDFISLTECTNVLRSIEEHLGILPSLDTCQKILVCAVSIRENDQWLGEVIHKQKILLTSECIVFFERDCDSTNAPRFFDTCLAELAQARKVMA